MHRLKQPNDISATETKSEDSCESEYFESSNNENLIDFFLSNLNEKSTFEQIREVAKIAIIDGMAKNNNTKRNWILSALKKLETLEVSIKMQTILLAAIEVVILSRRISNLRRLGIFSREVAENNNYCLSLNGARIAILTYFPKLNVNFLSCPYSPYKIDQAEIIKVKENLTKNEALWLVVTYEGSLHLTLIRVQFVNDKLTIHVFDSMAAMPKFSGKNYDSELYQLMDSIKNEMKPKKESIKYVSTSRQLDSTNCFSFVLLDLRAALNLFSAGKKCFLNKKISDKEEEEEKWLYKNVKEYTAFSPAFYKVAQNREVLPPEVVNTWNRRVISKKSRRGNPEALLTNIRTLEALVNEKIHFTSPNYQEDGESEEDIQRDCYSTL